MIHLSQLQLVGLWSELEQAYFDCNGYGGCVAEIFAFRLHEHRPTLAHEGVDSSIISESNIECYKQAAKTFVAVLKLFEKERNCKIELGEDRISIAQWKKQNPQFTHRAEVWVIPKKSK